MSSTANQQLSAVPDATAGASDTPFHPDFSDSAADIVLVASDGIRFRVHSVVLRMTSSVFKDMLSLPRTGDEDGIVHLPEMSSVLEPILRLICGLNFHITKSSAVLEGIAVTARKYDMAGPLCYLRELLLPSPAAMSPLQVYALALTAGFPDVAKEVLPLTLDVDIHSPENEPELLRLETTDLLALIKLRRKRKAYMQTFFSSATNRKLAHTAAGVYLNKLRCSSCAVPDNMFNELSMMKWWANMQARVMKELDGCPSAKFMTDRSFEAWDESVAPPASFSCQCGQSGRRKATKAEVLSMIREVALSLPAS